MTKTNAKLVEVVHFQDPDTGSALMLVERAGVLTVEPEGDAVDGQEFCDRVNPVVNRATSQADAFLALRFAGADLF